jgi:bla regulator protein blaR1
MNDFLIYSLQTVILQLLFLLVFELFFKKETFFKANRFYLLGSTVLSLIIPLLKIPIQEKAQQQYVFQLKEVVLSNAGFVENQIENISFQTSLNIVYGIGFLVFLSFFIFKLFKIFQVKQKATLEIINDIKVYRIENSKQAFSFFNYIFVGQDNQNIDVIIKHEKVHHCQIHSLDLLFLEFLKVVFWFNPLIYFFQKRIVEIHEFEADSDSISENKSSYYENLICQIFEVNSISLTNNFYNQSLIKKRLVMLQKSKSKKAGMMKYLVVVPMTVVSLMLFSTSVIAQVKEDKTLKELPNSDDPIPFAILDNPPTFEGCEDKTGNESKECFMTAMNNHIKTHFNYPKEAFDKKVQGRITIMFQITKEGLIDNLNVRGTGNENSYLLEEEAIRIIKLLPKFKPGMIEGKPVAVSYAQPIAFRLLK